MKNQNLFDYNSIEAFQALLMSLIFISLAYVCYEAFQAIWEHIANQTISEINRWTTASIVSI